MKFFAFVPARSGSKRIKDKNLSLVNGKSLIQVAVESCISAVDISDTYIVTDSPIYEKHALDYGSNTLGLRPPYLSTDISTDRQWLIWAISELSKNLSDIDDLYYVIVRPTSPFRDSVCLQSAIHCYKQASPDRTTCLRSIVKVSQHPGKMWKLVSPSRMTRLLPFNQNNDESTNPVVLNAIETLR